MSLRQVLLQSAFRTSGVLSAVRERLHRRPPSPDECLLLTAYTRDIADYGDLASENKRRYALKHGYHFRACTDGFVTGRPPAWSKIHFIREALRCYRFVFWTDADSLIMNDGIRLESFIAPGADVHLTRTLTPFPHLNTGQMLFRASPFTTLFLNAVWRLEVFTHDSAWEQRAINHLCESYRLSRVQISPNRRFNSLGHVPGDPDPYQDGDFIIHFPGLPDKTSLMTRYATHSSRASS